MDHKDSTRFHLSINSLCLLAGIATSACGIGIAEPSTVEVTAEALQSSESLFDAGSAAERTQQVASLSARSIADAPTDPSDVDCCKVARGICNGHVDFCFQLARCVFKCEENETEGPEGL